MRYKIETKYVYGWDEAGWTDDTDDGNKLLRFECVREAEAELVSFFASVKAAVASGDMDIEENPADYRIVGASV